MIKQQNEMSVYIFSAELDTKTAKENKERTERLVKILNNWAIPHTKVIGSYKGTLENSFRVPAKFIHPKFLSSIMFGTFGQESVLRISGIDRTGTLVYSNGAQTKIGSLHSTSIKYALNNLEAFTIYANKAYYLK